jgi:hypothetical protein
MVLEGNTSLVTHSHLGQWHKLHSKCDVQGENEGNDTYILKWYPIDH